MKLKDFIDEYGEYEIKDKEELEELLINRNKKWKPIQNEEYWFVNDNGYVKRSIWENHNIDNYRYKFLRLFGTKKEVERYLEIQKACYEASFKFDWNDFYKNKYYFCYSFVDKELCIMFNNDLYYNAPFYFKSKEIAQSLVDRFGEENIIKYVLEVEL